MDPEGPWDDEDSDEGWFCGSPACQLLRVKEGRPAAVSNDTNPITAVRLATWNSNVLGACDFLVPNQYVCITRRGGSWVGPSDSEIPDDGEGPVRGGPGSTPSLPILDNPTWPLANVQDGIAPDCNRYVLANSTIASCWKIANDNGISQARLFELNFILGEPDGHAGIELSSFYEWNTVLANGD
uniref:LysM domain-containing protein n=1 Tax=Colletotrichum fructicola (strain Nara gc5) TaxID=1213859 RepID=L2FKQ3_COLFN